MKKGIVLFVILLTYFNSFSQTDSTKIEQYCELIVTPRVFSNKVTIDVNYGEEKSFWRDSRLKDDDGKIKKFNTVVDALNYMGKSGWIFINAYPVKTDNTEIYHFAFRKLFTLSQLNG